MRDEVNCSLFIAGKSYAFGRLDRCLKESLLEEHVGEPISLEERSSERISERNCLSGEVRGGPWTGESGRPSGREQPMGEEWGEALPLELSRSKSFGCSFKIGPIESLAEDGYLFVWLWLVVNDRKFLVGTVFFSHTNQPAVLLHEPANRTGYVVLRNWRPEPIQVGFTWNLI